MCLGISKGSAYFPFTATVSRQYLNLFYSLNKKGIGIMSPDYRGIGGSHCEGERDLLYYTKSVYRMAVNKGEL